MRKVFFPSLDFRENYFCGFGSLWPMNNVLEVAVLFFLQHRCRLCTPPPGIVGSGFSVLILLLTSAVCFPHNETKLEKSKLVKLAGRNRSDQSYFKICVQPGEEMQSSKPYFVCQLTLGSQFHGNIQFQPIYKPLPISVVLL